MGARVASSRRDTMQARDVTIKKNRDGGSGGYLVLLYQEGDTLLEPSGLKWWFRTAESARNIGRGLAERHGVPCIDIAY